MQNDPGTTQKRTRTGHAVPIDRWMRASVCSPRVAAVYVFMLTVIRALGRRTVGNFSAFDLLVADVDIPHLRSGQRHVGAHAHRMRIAALRAGASAVSGGR
jgi:hypothetical protein